MLHADFGGGVNVNCVYLKYCMVKDGFREANGDPKMCSCLYRIERDKPDKYNKIHCHCQRQTILVLITLCIVSKWEHLFRVSDNYLNITS